MNIYITHVSVRFDFAFTYNIPQGCAYAHLRIPYLTEQAPHVSWESHHNKVFTIHLMDLNHSPNHPGWLYPLLPGRDSSLLKYSAHDPTIGSICQPANPSRYSTSQSFCASLFPLSTHNITSVVFGKYRVFPCLPDNSKTK